MSIRTELLAHANIEKALKIEKLLLYLEDKGKSENTLFAVRKNLTILAKKRITLRLHKSNQKAVSWYRKTQKS